PSPVTRTGAAAATAADMTPFAGDPPGDAPTNLDIRQRSPIKRLLPQTMFFRSLLLIVMPLVLLQIIATWIFYDRHWEAVSYRFSSDVAGDIAVVIDALKLSDSAARRDRFLDSVAPVTEITFSLNRDRVLPAPRPTV